MTLYDLHFNTPEHYSIIKNKHPDILTLYTNLMTVSNHIDIDDAYDISFNEFVAALVFINKISKIPTPIS